MKICQRIIFNCYWLQAYKYRPLRPKFIDRVEYQNKEMNEYY